MERRRTPTELIIKQLERIRPDVIAIVGDLIEKDEDPLPFSFLCKCTETADTFLSLGNHERKITSNQIKEMSSVGIQVLDNDWKQYRDCFCFGGIPWS